SRAGVVMVPAFAGAIAVRGAGSAVARQRDGALALALAVALTVSLAVELPLGAIRALLGAVELLLPLRLGGLVVLIGQLAQLVLELLLALGGRQPVGHVLQVARIALRRVLALLAGLLAQLVGQPLALLGRELL